MTVVSGSTWKQAVGGGEGGAASAPIGDVRFIWFLGQGTERVADGPGAELRHSSTCGALEGITSGRREMAGE